MPLTQYVVLFFCIVSLLADLCRSLLKFSSSSSAPAPVPAFILAPASVPAPILAPARGLLSPVVFPTSSAVAAKGKGKGKDVRTISKAKLVEDEIDMDYNYTSSDDLNTNIIADSDIDECSNNDRSLCTEQKFTRPSEKPLSSFRKIQKPRDQILFTEARRWRQIVDSMLQTNPATEMDPNHPELYRPVVRTPPWNLANRPRDSYNLMEWVENKRFLQLFQRVELPSIVSVFC